MKIVKLLILGLLLVGCSQVDKYGVTSEIHSELFSTREDATGALKSEFNIICLENGYRSYKPLSIYTARALQYGTYKAVGRARCLK